MRKLKIGISGVILILLVVGLSTNYWSVYSDSVGSDSGAGATVDMNISLWKECLSFKATADQNSTPVGIDKCVDPGQGESFIATERAMNIVRACRALGIIGAVMILISMLLCAKNGPKKGVHASLCKWLMAGGAILSLITALMWAANFMRFKVVQNNKIFFGKSELTFKPGYSYLIYLCASLVACGHAVFHMF